MHILSEISASRGHLDGGSGVAHVNSDLSNPIFLVDLKSALRTLVEILLCSILGFTIIISVAPVVLRCAPLPTRVSPGNSSGRRSQQLMTAGGLWSWVLFPCRARYDRILSKRSAHASCGPPLSPGKDSAKAICVSMAFYQWEKFFFLSMRSVSTVLRAR